MKRRMAYRLDDPPWADRLDLSLVEIVRILTGSVMVAIVMFLVVASIVIVGGSQ